MTQQTQLSRGIAVLGLTASPAQLATLLHYCALLAKWNRVYNLTALRDETQMVSHHVLDSLSVLPHLTCARLADVGSGGGLPGIPLAIMRPDLEVTLIETSHKKSSFQNQAKIELALPNLRVLHTRVENHQDASGFDGIISRAFSSMSDFVTLTAPLLATGGYLYAMKGVYPVEEISSLPPEFAVKETVRLEVPDVDAARHLVILHRR